MCCVADAVVVNRYQLLKGLNPSIDLVTEMMMPQSVSFLASTTPVRGVDHRYLHLLSPAYISGSGGPSTLRVGWEGRGWGGVWGGGRVPG
jgi:hypothetical protein